MLNYLMDQLLLIATINVTIISQVFSQRREVTTKIMSACVIDSCFSIRKRKNRITSQRSVIGQTSLFVVAKPADTKRLSMGDRSG